MGFVVVVVVVVVVVSIQKCFLLYNYSQKLGLSGTIVETSLSAVFCIVCVCVCGHRCSFGR